jgi:tetratricopeptide (TPR) repeat protein
MSDVLDVIAAAYAHDRAGREYEAIKAYELAVRLGVPDGERRRFLVGYGSTLRNVGRADEAVGVLAQAVADDPGYAPFVAFLALALADAGHHRAALGTMLGCVLDVAGPGSLDGYERALATYHHELLARDSGGE